MSTEWHTTLRGTSMDPLNYSDAERGVAFDMAVVRLLIKKGITTWDEFKDVLSETHVVGRQLNMRRRIAPGMRQDPEGREKELSDVELCLEEYMSDGKMSEEDRRVARDTRRMM